MSPVRREHKINLRTNDRTDPCTRFAKAKSKSTQLETGGALGECLAYLHLVAILLAKRISMDAMTEIRSCTFSPIFRKFLMVRSIVDMACVSVDL